MVHSGDDEVPAKDPVGLLDSRLCMTLSCCSQTCDFEGAQPINQSKVNCVANWLKGGSTSCPSQGPDCSKRRDLYLAIVPTTKRTPLNFGQALREEAERDEVGHLRTIQLRHLAAIRHGTSDVYSKGMTSDLATFVFLRPR